MRLLLLVSGIVLAITAIGTGAKAQTYPWCAIYGGDFGGTRNCGFVTRDQCMTFRQRDHRLLHSE